MGAEVQLNHPSGQMKSGPWATPSCVTGRGWETAPRRGPTLRPPVAFLFFLFGKNQTTNKREPVGWFVWRHSRKVSCKLAALRSLFGFKGEIPQNGQIGVLSPSNKIPSGVPEWKGPSTCRTYMSHILQHHQVHLKKTSESNLAGNMTCSPDYMTFDNTHTIG